jgi:superfamily I DNA/RNA helicase
MAGYEPTDEQRAVLDHEPDRHARLLAGPGTGKSATVVALITKLLENSSPQKVRLLTFTRAATAELAQKVSEHPDLVVDRPSTIHSFAISLLLRNPGSADFPDPLRIADEWEVHNLIEAELAAMVGVTPTFVHKNLIPEMAANWESLEAHEDPEVDEQTRNRFLGAWDEHRRIYGYTLLAELPDLLRRALETHDDLEGLDFDMLVVDEYQDLNACDLQVLRLLAGRGVAVFAVGDDEQSIYSFRKAAPEGILRFPEDYAGCADYTLSVSHRCGSDIIEWARHVIEGEPTREVDRPRLVPVDGADAGEAALLSFRSNVAEARGVADLIRHLVEDEGLAPSDVLVLFRGDHNGVFSKPIKAELNEMGISIDDPAWVDEVLDEANNRAVILMVRLLHNRYDSLAWAGLMHLEPGVGATFRRSIYDRAKADHTGFGEALLNAYADSFPDSPTAPAKKAKELVQRVIEWLDGQEVPEQLEDGRWGAWIIEALALDEGDGAATEDLAQLLLGVDEMIERKVPLRMFGQELQAESYAVAQMNSIIHDMDVELERGDTVINPKFRNADGALRNFDIVIANPMWNQPFDPDLFLNDPFDRFTTAGGITSGKGDWAWLQHTLSCMSDHGRAAVVLDTGAVTRGSGSKNEDKERNIRKWFVEHDLIEGVIVLPENLFYNTTAAGVIVILSKRKAPARKGKIVLLNASKRFTKGKPKNHLVDADIADLAKKYLAGEPLEGEVRVIEAADAVSADYNLSPSLWVTQPDNQEHRPVKEIIADLLELDARARDIDATLAELLVKL